MGGLIRAINVSGFDDVVTDLGGHPASLRARFGLPVGVEDEDEAFVSFGAFAQMLEASAAALDRSDFGLLLAQRQGLRILGPIAVIARNADTIAEGIEAIARFMPAHSTALRLGIGEPAPDGTVRIRYDVSDPSSRRLRQPYELAMSNAAQILRLLTGGRAGPSRIWLPHPPQNPAAVYADHLGCPITFEADWCGFAVGADVLGWQIDAADPQTRRVATAYLESTFPDLDAPLPQRVGEVVRRLLPTGHYSADIVAEHLHLHRRTLQRRLLDSGATYAGILEQQRRDLAMRYLDQPQMQIGQIAALLGYADQTAFNKAFRRWFATSPREFRRPDRVDQLR